MRARGLTDLVPPEDNTWFRAQISGCTIEGNDAARRQAREDQQRDPRSGLIVLGAGFWASAIRGVMTTISSLRAASHLRKLVRYEQESVRPGVIVVGASIVRGRASIECT